MPFIDTATCEPMRIWSRLEPRARQVEFDGVLPARIHDPLWLLARQWQMGEFKGEDTGSAVLATLARRSPRDVRAGRATAPRARAARRARSRSTSRRSCAPGSGRSFLARLAAAARRTIRPRRRSTARHYRALFRRELARRRSTRPPTATSSRAPARSPTLAPSAPRSRWPATRSTASR